MVVDYPEGVAPTRPGGSPPRHPGVGLLSSGTTGQPKLVRHTWETLFSAERCRSARPRRWLVPYQAGTYAWYQLVTMGLFQPGQDLVPLATLSGEAFVRAALEHGVDSVSSTPTLWRLTLLEVAEEKIRRLPLEQITLGGEIVDQALLDRLQVLFPNARLTHIYASSEAGACIVVGDGEAGFPTARLDEDGAGRPSLRVSDGHLLVRSPHSAATAGGRPDEWLDTGDLVEVRGPRVVFLGRADSRVIGVGGAKLFAGDIEDVVLQHPAVSWCRVRSARAPLVGSLPEVDVVLDPNAPPPTDADLEAHCRTRLPEPSVPRFWNRLGSVPIQASLKSER